MRIHQHHAWWWGLAFGFVGSALAVPGNVRSGLLDEKYYLSRRSGNWPDFEKYIHLKTLEWSYFPNTDHLQVSQWRTKSVDQFGRKDKAERRMIIVGDIHGMVDSLGDLLDVLKYSPSRDTLIHTGDVTYRGSSSLQVLDFLASHNVSGVRGNHDQRVVEWRAWIEWILDHEGGLKWLEEEEQRAAEDSELTKKSKKGRGRSGEPPSLWSDASKDKWKRIPEDWKMMGEHYQIARNMTAAAASYLFSLPIALHIPQLHTFVVHGGILPSDPTEDLTDESQPLAHTPDIDRSSAEDGDALATLRRVQERALLEDIPQNTNPWVILNMRGVTKENEITRDGDDPNSTPWSEIWNSVVSLCNGFGDIEDSTVSGDGLYASIDHQQVSLQEYLSSESSAGTKKHIRLPCHPATVVYGHAATRGLDIKRWSKGLDSGCSYGRRLTSLVLTRNGVAFDIDSNRREGIETKRTKFGEKDLSVDAHVVSVPCTVSDPEQSRWSWRDDILSA